MNQFLKFGIKAIAAVFALGVAAKLGTDAIEHKNQIKNKQKQ